MSVNVNPEGLDELTLDGRTLTIEGAPVYLSVRAVVIGPETEFWVELRVAPAEGTECREAEGVSQVVSQVCRKFSPFPSSGKRACWSIPPRPTAPCPPWPSGPAAKTAGLPRERGARSPGWSGGRAP